MDLKAFITSPELPIKLIKGTLHTTTVGLILGAGLGVANIHSKVSKYRELHDEASARVESLSTQAEVNGVKDKVREKIAKCSEKHFFCEKEVRELTDNAGSPGRVMYESLFGQPAGLVKCEEKLLNCFNNISPF